MRVLKRALVKWSRYSYERGLTAAFGGNLSVRRGNLIFIKSTGSVMRELTTETIATITLKGEITSSLTPSSEYRLHLRIYKKRPDVLAIAHLHPLSSIVVSTLFKKNEVPLVTPEAKLYLKKLPVVPFREAGSEELAIEVAKSLEKTDAVLMEKHGIVTIGRTLREAVYKAELVEENCTLILRSLTGLT